MLPTEAVAKATAQLSTIAVGLAITIELVPEQVRSDDDRGAELGEDLPQRDLIDFEHRVPAARVVPLKAAMEVGGSDERGHDPLAHVRSGAIRDGHRARPADDLRDEPGGRGLPFVPTTRIVLRSCPASVESASGQTRSATNPGQCSPLVVGGARQPDRQPGESDGGRARIRAVLGALRRSGNGPTTEARRALLTIAIRSSTNMNAT